MTRVFVGVLMYNVNGNWEVLQWTDLEWPSHAWRCDCCGESAGGSPAAAACGSPCGAVLFSGQRCTKGEDSGMGRASSELWVVL